MKFLAKFGKEIKLNATEAQDSDRNNSLNQRCRNA